MSGSTNNAKIIGSGSDTITLLMSQDPDGPAGAPGTDGEFTLNVDGQQIGGIQDISALHAAGQDQAFTFAGDFAPGQHQVTVTFVNNNGTPGDKSSVGDSGDRNIYVDGVTYDGQSVSNVTTPIYQSPGAPPNLSSVVPGNAVFTVNDTTAIPDGGSPTAGSQPGPVNAGSGPDTLTLQMAEDPYNGDARFTVSVDGQQVGGTFTTTAVQYEGQQQAFNLSGNWGSGSHSVTVNYLSDSIGATTGDGLALDNQDQNLYVHSVSYDGVQADGTPLELANDGPETFNIPAGGQAGTSNTASVTSASLSAGSPSSGPAFVAPAADSGTSASTSPAPGAAGGAGDSTIAGSAPTTQDFTATPVAGSTDSAGTGTTGAGAYWPHQPPQTGGSGIYIPT